MRIGTTHNDYLVVSRCTRFGWNRCNTVSTVRNFQYFARFAWQRLTPKHCFCGILPLKWGGNINETAKSHILARVRVVWAISIVKIRRRVWPVGEFPKEGGYAYKEINMVLKFRYVSPICPEAPRGQICMHQIWYSKRGRRRNHLWQIFGDRLSGVDSAATGGNLQ